MTSAVLAGLLFLPAVPAVSLHRAWKAVIEFIIVSP